MDPNDDKSPEALVKQWKELVDRMDAELTKAGLTDEQREQLVREILEEDSEGST